MTDDRWTEWKEILGLTPDGKVNVDQLKLELMDYDDMIERMSKVTDLISGGILSYPTYKYETLEASYHDRVNRMINETIEDMIEDGELREVE